MLPVPAPSGRHPTFGPGARRPLRHTGPVQSQAVFEPIRSSRTFESAIEHIVEGIERAGLREGDRLPMERELAAQLGISTPTLRQALVVLGRTGLLQVRPGKGGGVFLAAELVPDQTISDEVALEEDAAIDTLRARRLIETAIARHAALVATEDDFARLDRANELLERHLDDRELVMRADAGFHRALVRSCHSPALQTAMRGISRSLHPIRDAYTGGRAENVKTLAVHRAQLDAMRRRDLDELRVVLDEHLRMLEDLFAFGIGRAADELFGIVR